MKVFPNIVQPKNSNMCGAYSLVAGLDYLGCLSDKRSVFLNKLDLSSKKFTGEFVELKYQKDLNEKAQLVYLVTGIIPEEDPSIFRYTNNGLNSIIAMAYVAQKFGLSSSIVIKDADTFSGLSECYPQELELANSYGFTPLIGSEHLTIRDNEVLLPTIVQPDGAKHSIALDYNNCLFDPATGKTCTVKPLTEWPNWLGVALKLTRTHA